MSHPREAAEGKYSEGRRQGYFWHPEVGDNITGLCSVAENVALLTNPHQLLPFFPSVSVPPSAQPSIHL